MIGWRLKFVVKFIVICYQYVVEKISSDGHGKFLVKRRKSGPLRFGDAKKVVWIWPRVSSGSMDKASDYLSVSITKKRRDKTLIHATFLCKKNINNKIHRFCSNFEIRGFLSLWARILLWWPGLPFYAKPINERHFLKLQNEHVGPIKIGF